MSISSSLSNAVSGLTAVARNAEVISANIANVTTEGYGRRDVLLSSSIAGGGVRVDGISRNVNFIAVSDRRLAEASFGAAAAPFQFYQDLENSFGLPGDPTALTTAISDLETSIVTSIGRPEDAAGLRDIVAAATNVATKINDISETIQSQRQTADQTIGLQVNQINSSLKLIENMNNDIRRMSATGQDISSLLDQRQTEVDKVASLIPIKEVPRDGNQISLVTPTGTTLLQKKAAQFSFTPSPVITPAMTIGNGALSGLTIDGAASRLGDAALAISGGALAANFAIRDELAPNALAQVDALARNVIERFSGPAADASLAVGQAGLFTDGGSDFNPVTEQNVSARISVNAIVDPNQAGDPVKLRDGIASATSVSVGEAGNLESLRAAMTAQQIPASGAFSLSGGTSALANDILSQFGSQLRSAEAEQAYTSARTISLKDIELQSGVSTDDQMQRLLVVEQAYAANAKVIQAVDEMLQSLLRI